MDKMNCICGLAMADFSVGDIYGKLCEKCGLLFLGQAAFDTMVNSTKRSFRLSDVSELERGCEARRETLKIGKEASFNYLKCPVCDKFMTRKDLFNVTGIIINECKGHGYLGQQNWLQDVIHFFENGGDLLIAKNIEKHLKQEISDVSYAKGQAEISANIRRRSD